MQVDLSNSDKARVTYVLASKPTQPVEAHVTLIPQMKGGVTTPAQLRKIADVAEKYEVPMVKVTGGQRIDLLGVRKEDLPAKDVFKNVLVLGEHGAGAAMGVASGPSAAT